MMMNLPSEELLPQPDYDFIESYDQEINRLQERRMSLLEQIIPGGAYDQGMPELSAMLENADGQYTAIQNLNQRISAAGGVDNFIFHIPLTEKSQVLQQLTEQITFVRAQVDEVLGIADIVRGVTSASETATAQEIKGRWVGVRLTRKRECVQYTVREMMRIMAQLLASHITPDNLARMTQMPITEEMQTILQQDMLMEFVIDIETDSTIAKDEYKERATHQEMLNGVGQWASTVLPAVTDGSLPADTGSAILRAALKPYARYDRNLEESLSSLTTTTQQLQGLNQQIQQLTQERDQTQQQAQQWEQYATQLQQEATQASSAQKQADAEKKQAEKDLIRTKIPDQTIQPAHTIAQIRNLDAQTATMNDPNERRDDRSNSQN
jgi:hypothetical protein